MVPVGVTIASQPWHTFFIDVMGSVPQDKRKQFILLFIDDFSQSVILVSTAKQTATTITHPLMIHVAAYFRVPASLQRDQEWEITGNIWQLQEILKCTT